MVSEAKKKLNYYFGGRKMGDSKCIKNFLFFMLNGACFGIWTFCIFPFLRKGKELFDAAVKIV